MLYTHGIRPLLFRFTDPESIHHFSIRLLNWLSSQKILYHLIRHFCAIKDKRLHINIGGLTLENPVGLAAGFDKNCEAPNGYAMLGFGFAELGSITYREQPGNPRPRVWRLPKDKSIIVFYGLANLGVQKTATILATMPHHPIPFGISIAPTTGVPLESMADEYLAALKLLHTHAEYITLNVSCPNVAKCEMVSQLSFIESLLKTITRYLKDIGETKPLFIKIGAEHSDSELQQIVQLCIANGVTGIIATNLLKNRSNATLKSTPDQINHPGGISGQPLAKLSEHTISQLYRYAQGKIKIIGVGGIFTAEDAYRKIQCGASAVQIITGFIYGGPTTVRRINRGLLKLLERDGFTSIAEAVGSGIQKDIQ